MKHKKDSNHLNVWVCGINWDKWFKQYRKKRENCILNTIV
jgi:hypothetical protein